MLQLNHVTIYDNNRLILNDCTFQFPEGRIYIIDAPKDIYVPLFLVFADEKKPAQGQVVTWDGAKKTNMVDGAMLPSALTCIEYLRYLQRIAPKTKKETSTSDDKSLLEAAGISESDANIMIDRISEDISAKLRLEAAILLDTYVILFGDNIPDSLKLVEFFNDRKDDKVIICASEDEETVERLISECNAVRVTVKDGSICV